MSSVESERDPMNKDGDIKQRVYNRVLDLLEDMNLSDFTGLKPLAIRSHLKEAVDHFLLEERASLTATEREDLLTRLSNNIQV
jgi:hypothetical protein